jgi:hypothetical protein
VVVVGGLAVGLATVVELNPVPGDQLIEVAPVVVPPITVLEPVQIVE